ncbi:histidine--tRNA ligase [Parvularcula dongshanensis]|uniref:Histidine--tRNA ligase n=1 Tax=Parvularcula dongshanensis TaxID=1173995 RepID=A0A840I0S6_9PROT|nr:histidine--tRNA ligase [Parvularcula dongshanensis]MBB4658666.1 histidyl-tRNA synthetase [Parvularcula dongshanensis]
MAKKKTFRPKPRRPRGFRDRSGEEILAEQAMLRRICDVYASYGFMPLETPAFEFTDALGKFLPDVDRPNEGVFSLQDDDEQWMSLRYDLTAPLARHVAENYDALPKPFRRYQVGTVWRNEKPGPGRFREFTQCDADSVGAPAPHADAEAIMMFADAIRAAGLEDRDVKIRVSSRKVMSGLLEAVGLDPEDKGVSGTVLRAMDKYDRLGAEGVRLLLGQGRKDESGDFTQGAGLSDGQADHVLAFMEAASDDDAAAIAQMRGVMGGSAVGAEGADELDAIAETLAAMGYASRVRIDPSVVRGLDYYTGPVFEAEVTFPVQNEKGETVVFGSVGSGGRYDDLVKRFKGVEVPAVGCSIGVSRLLTALAARGEAQAARGPVVVLALEADRMPAYHRMAAALRAEGIRAEVYLGGSGMRAQLKYADKRAAPVVVIQGEDERTQGEVTVKDLELGAKLSETVESNEEWRSGQPAQVTVPEGELIAAVKRALGAD